MFAGIALLRAFVAHVVVTKAIEYIRISITVEEIWIVGDVQSFTQENVLATYTGHLR